MPRISFTTLTRTKSRIISTAACVRPGTSRARRATTTMKVTSTSAAISRTSMIRLNSSQVPWNSTGAGKKSAIEGGSKPPVPL